jgi:hypothetical protein
MAELARQVQEITGHTVKVAFADQGYTGEEAAQAARDEGVELQVIKLQEAKKSDRIVQGGSARFPVRKIVVSRAENRLHAPTSRFVAVWRYGSEKERAAPGKEDEYLGSHR